MQVLKQIHASWLAVALVVAVVAAVAEAVAVVVAAAVAAVESDMIAWTAVAKFLAGLVAYEAIVAISG